MGVGRAAPCTCRGQIKSNSKLAEGWRGGSGCGDAASPPPGPGPAAGGCAFGRLRSSASQAKRPHPCKLGRRLLVALSCAHGKTRVGRPAQPARGTPRAHAAHAPTTGPNPAFDSSQRRAVDPRHAWMKRLETMDQSMERKRWVTSRSSAAPNTPRPTARTTPGWRPAPGGCRPAGSAAPARRRRTPGRPSTWRRHRAS